MALAILFPARFDGWWGRRGRGRCLLRRLWCRWPGKTHETDQYQRRDPTRDRVVQPGRARGKGEYDLMGARGQMKAADHAVAAENRFRLAVDGGVPRGVEAVIEKHDARDF